LLGCTSRSIGPLTFAYQKTFGAVGSVLSWTYWIWVYLIIYSFLVEHYLYVYDIMGTIKNMFICE